MRSLTSVELDMCYVCRTHWGQILKMFQSFQQRNQKKGNLHQSQWRKSRPSRRKRPQNQTNPVNQSKQNCPVKPNHHRTSQDSSGESHTTKPPKLMRQATKKVRRPILFYIYTNRSTKDLAFIKYIIILCGTSRFSQIVGTDVHQFCPQKFRYVTHPETHILIKTNLFPLCSP